jgi:ABC-type multidrug transport system fused ATPase/permease subunit
MFSAFLATFNALVRLRRRIPISRAKVVLSLGLLLFAGALEGATIGLLVPLLEMLTGSASSAPSGKVRVLLDTLFQAVGHEARVALLGVAIILVVALKNAVGYAGVAVAGGLRKVAIIELRRQLLDVVLNAPPSTLERHTSGELTGILTTEAWRVNRILDQGITILHRAIIAASYFAAILILSWRLTLVTVALGVVLAVMSQWFGKRALALGRELTEANVQLARQVTEIVGGLRVIRTTASGKVQRETFERHSLKHAESDVSAGLSQAMLLGTIETLGIAGAMGLTALAYVLWLRPGELDGPSFLAFGFGLVRLLPALNQMSGGIGVLTTLIGSLERVLMWLELPRYPTRPFGKAMLPPLKQGIRFEDVGFGYADGKDVLSSLSFFLPAGSTLAVLGASGSGKSTLASLLLRLREPSKGRILFDETEHWEFAVREFHRAVAFVEQEPFMFNTTIRENVTCGLPDVDRETVLDALERVQLGDMIKALPDGIETTLAERGATLSGGQRQRLAIARAIVRNPQVLVLDEPTSALDAETEQEVVKAIDAASVGRTTIIITHRASTVEHATLRLHLDTGRMETRRSVGGGPALGADRSAKIS